jgi:hypothetical protein
MRPRSQSQIVVDDINTQWHDAVFSEYNKRDFNVVIAEVRVKRSKEISAIKELFEGIGSDIKTMNPPDGKERDFQRLKELYLLFNKYADMAVSSLPHFLTSSLPHFLTSSTLPNL